MRFIANVISIIFLITSIAACKDDPDDWTLPPITMTGAGTFGCKVDGKVYLPHGSYSGAFADTGSTMISVVASGDPGNFNIAVRDTVTSFEENKAYYFVIEGKGTTCEYNDGGKCRYDQSPVSGYIKFSRIDYGKHIVSGVFEFTAFSPECNKTINITEGRFDLRTDL